MASFLFLSYKHIKLKLKVFSKRLWYFYGRLTKKIYFSIVQEKLRFWLILFYRIEPQKLGRIDSVKNNSLKITKPFQATLLSLD